MVTTSKMPSQRIRSSNEIRQMVAKMSPEEIVRLIPKDKLAKLLSEGEKIRKSARRKKKVVNGFMAFRSYYAGIVPGRTQKEKSPFLTTLWQPDPLKPKWTMMANAYSRVRDFAGAGAKTGRMSMSGFLYVACPIMGITNPADYFSTFNWVLQQRARQEHPTLYQSGIPTIVNEVQVPVTEVELLRACVRGGFPLKDSAALFRAVETNSVGIMAQASSSSTPPAQGFSSSFTQNPAGMVTQHLGSHSGVAVNFNVHTGSAHPIHPSTPAIQAHDEAFSVEDIMAAPSKTSAFDGHLNGALGGTFPYSEQDLGFW